MQYGKYKAWLSGLNPNVNLVTNPHISEYIRPMYQDDVTRQMVGLKLLEDNIIDKGVFEIILLKNISNYF